MPQGPIYFERKSACIYCGMSNVRLTDEHVVPYSLGGSHVLRHASCLRCADVTKKFEQLVARDLWGDARTSFNGPTRRKRERQSHIFVPDPFEHTMGIRVPAGEYPAGLVFYKMSQAGLLQGLPESVDLSYLWQIMMIDDQERRAKFLERYPGKLTLKFRHVPEAFGRLLAKIGYCQILTSLDPVEFRPICLPYIMGVKKNVSFIVGGTMDDQIPQPDIGYSLSTAIFGSSTKIMLVAVIRLYANTRAPAYHVVVGDVSGEDNVSRVISKLNLSDEDTTLTSSGPSQPHWAPSILPLPFWVGV